MSSSGREIRGGFRFITLHAVVLPVHRCSAMALKRTVWSAFRVLVLTVFLVAWSMAGDVDDSGCPHSTEIDRSRPECQSLQCSDYCDVLHSVTNTSYYDEVDVQNRTLVNLGLLLAINAKRMKSDMWFLEHVASIALANVECRKVLEDYKIRLVVVASDCSAPTAAKHLLDAVGEHNIIGTIGPTCSVAAKAVGVFAPYINIPILGYSNDDAELSKNQTYSSYLRINPSGEVHTEGWFLLMKRQNWTKIFIIEQIEKEFSEYVIRFEERIKKDKNGGGDIQPPIMHRVAAELEKFNATEVLNKIESHNVRIVAAMVHPPLARKLLCVAQQRKLTSCCNENERKLVFIWPGWFNPTVWLTPLENETVNCTFHELKKSAEGSFYASGKAYEKGTVSLHNTSTSLGLNKTVCDIKKSFSHAVEYTKKHCSHDDNETEWNEHFAGYLYDAVWTWAFALRDIENRETNKSNLARIQDRDSDLRRNLVGTLQNVTFRGISGLVQFVGNDNNGSWGTLNNLNHKLPPPSCFEEFGDLMVATYENGTNLSFRGNLSLSFGTCDATNPCSSPPDYIVKESSGDCPGLEPLESLLNSCNGAVAMVVSLTFIACLIIIFILTTHCVKYHLERRYLHLAAKRLQKFGMSENEAYMALETDKKWEINRNDVVISSKLGEGAFGLVFSADVFGLNDEECSPAAVKMLKENSSPEQKAKFLIEVQLMKRFQHPNIVRLLGMCTLDEPLYMVMELMLYGDLRTFLLTRRHLCNTGDADEVTSSRMTSMALCVANGLHYLHSHNYIHRDVAARNIMVTTGFTLKIGDFGLSHDVSQDSLYRVSHPAMLPIRWLSRESLIEGVFTCATDIWSFGVLLWEMMTFGTLPFTGKTNEQVIEHVKNGGKLTMPKQCPDFVVEFVSQCWELSPSKRPTAEQLAAQLSREPNLIPPCADSVLRRSQDGHAAKNTDPASNSGLRRLLTRKSRSVHLVSQLDRIDISGSGLSNNAKPCSRRPNEALLKLRAEQWSKISASLEELSVPVTNRSNSLPLERLQPLANLSALIAPIQNGEVVNGDPRVGEMSTGNTWWTSGRVGSTLSVTHEAATDDEDWGTSL